MSVSISQLYTKNPITNPKYPDLLEGAVSAGGGTYTSGGMAIQALVALANGDETLVTTTTTLTAPLPNVIRYKFTTPGQIITLPAANAADPHPTGKMIWFYPDPANTQNFNINTADGTTYINNNGNNIFAVWFGSNSNQNGTPLGNFILFNSSVLGTAAYQNVTDFCQVANNLSDVNPEIARVNLDVPAIRISTMGNPNGAIPGTMGDICFDTSLSAPYPVYICNTTGNSSTAVWQLISLPPSSPNISGTTHTLSSADVGKLNLITNVAGCTITVNSNSLQTGETATFQRANGAGNIVFAAGTGTIESIPVGSLTVADVNGKAEISLPSDTNYYLRGDLTP